MVILFPVRVAISVLVYHRQSSLIKSATVAEDFSSYQYQHDPIGCCTRLKGLVPAHGVLIRLSLNPHERELGDQAPSEEKPTGSELSDSV